MNKCQFCGEETNLPVAYYPMTPILEEMEEKINKLGRKDWWKRLDDPDLDLNSKEAKELEDLTFYDQLINTFGKGVVCNCCLKRDDELYGKYYGYTE